jgi:transcriptional regulator with XRE-family HTH domain
MAEAGKRIKSAKGSQMPLHNFGAMIERARKFPGGGDRQPMTQDQLAKALEKGLEYEVSQSFTARLERGLVVDPSYELLRQLSEILDISFNLLVSLLVQDKYKIAREKLYTLANNPLTLDELADWEERATADQLWIVATKFVDNFQDRFRLAIMNIVSSSNRTVTFFIPRGYEDSFGAYRSEVLDETGAEPSALIQVGLHPEQVAVMAASYVIANPGAVRGRDTERSYGTEGYIILHDLGGEPEVAVKMSRNDIRARVAFLRTMRDKKLSDDEVSLGALPHSGRSRLGVVS